MTKRTIIYTERVRLMVCPGLTLTTCVVAEVCGCLANLAVVTE